MRKIDYFNPAVIPVCIIIFLVMGYIGSFNYRFENPLKSETILMVTGACVLFLAGVYFARFVQIKKHDLNYLSKNIILGVVVISLILQAANIILIGEIPLLNSTAKSNATTNIWRIAYPLFLIFINILLSKYYEKKYLLLVILGAVIFGLNGYRTSVIAILASSFITLYYLDKISKKTGAIFVSVIIIALLAVGYIASQSIAGQNWTLNPVELLFYRAAFTLEVFEKIIPLAGTTHGHILSMIFSSGSPRTFIGQYVLHYNVCLTSTLFGPVYLDFGLIGLCIQMLFMGFFITVLYNVKKGVGIGFYSIILTHTLIWIETGPTDIMIWMMYLITIVYILKR